jgi:uncharacterized membrane protein YGL010W
MSRIDALLNEYGESHQNATNKLIHWFCVPAILFSIIGLMMSIPWPFEGRTWYVNWAGVVGLLAFIYYLRLSLPMAVGFAVVLCLMLLGNSELMTAVGGTAADLATVSVIIFVVAWIGQFIGHKIEGKKPSFFKDVQFLLIGPAWLLHFLFAMFGLRY